MNNEMIPQQYLDKCGTQIQQATMRERFLQQEGELTKRLANINAAIEALDANPTFEKVLDVVQKVY